MRTAIGAIILAAAAANATAAVDFLQFYASREHQVFKEEDKRQTDYFANESETMFKVWKGFVSGKKLYVEVHDKRITLIHGQKETILPISRAAKLKDTDSYKRELYLPHLPDLYVKSTKDPSQSLLCVENIPDETVYLVTDPFGTPRLYRLSGENASCSEVERAPDGRLLVPRWRINGFRWPNVVIDYYAIDKDSFKKTGIRVTGRIVGENRDRTYEIDGSQAAAAANATAGVYFQQFYASRELQVFKEEDVREFDSTHRDGDEFKFKIWKEFVSGEKLRVELYADRIRLIHGQKDTILPFSRALMAEGADKHVPDLNPFHTNDLYLKSSKDPSQSLLCIDNRGSEVLLVTDPLGTPRLYIGPDIPNGDYTFCNGIERAPDGRLLVPSWDIDTNRSPNVVIDYYAIDKNSFTKTDIRVTGKVVNSEDDDEYKFKFDESR
jgi:hypothetical protein